MATSGTNIFENTFYIDEMFQEAYERVGVTEITGYHLTSARRSLNIMLQEWANRGLHYWEIGETNIDLVEGQAEYKFFRATTDGTSATTVAPADVYGIEDILEVTYRTDRTQTTQSDSAMNKIDRSTYSALANKLSKGTPNQYYVRRFSDHTSITFYPTPDSTAASRDAHIYFVKRIQDAGAYTNTVDVPYRFVPCMVSGLSYYLSQKYNPQLVQQTKMLYEDELNRALTEDGSSTSTYITPKAYYPNV
jgi:hypothetical protein|tara:strand:- start:2159 stop:2905 length:747 start_codon:yes stop_codon:yes gene_type:complete